MWHPTPQAALQKLLGFYVWLKCNLPPKLSTQALSKCLDICNHPAFAQKGIKTFPDCCTQFCRAVWNSCPNISSCASLNNAPHVKITTLYQHHHQQYQAAEALSPPVSGTCTVKHLLRKKAFCLELSKLLLCFCKGSSTCRNAHTAGYFSSFNIHYILCWNENHTTNLCWGSNISWTHTPLGSHMEKKKTKAPQSSLASFHKDHSQWVRGRMRNCSGDG